MSVGRFIQKSPPLPEWDPSKNLGLASALGDILLDINNKKVKVKQGKIRDIAKGMSEIAYSLGETNDEEGFAGELEEDIIEALKLVKKRLKEKK